MTHRKRLSAPKHFPIKRKHNTYVKNMEGSRSRDTAIPATVFLREVLDYCDTEKEATKVIEEGGLERNNETIKDTSEALGILDTIKVVKTGETFRAVRNGDRLEFVEVDDGSNTIAKIEDKDVKGDGFIYRLHNGENYRTEEEFDTGSTIEFVDGSVEEVKLEGNSNAIVVDGKHAGRTGTIQEISRKGLRVETIKIESNDEEIQTRVENAVAFDKVDLGDEE